MSFLINPYVFAAAGGGTTPEVEFDGRNLTGADTDPITTWDDSSGNNRDATTGGGGPKVASAVLNGNDVSRWDGGTGDHLAFTGNSVTGTFTVIAVLKCTDGGNRCFFSENTAGSGAPGVRIASNKIELISISEAVIATSTTSLNTTSFYTVAVTFDGSAWAFYLNGSADGSGTNSFSFTRRFSEIGTAGGNQNPFLGDIAYVAYWASVLSGSELTTRFNDLRTVWNHY